MLSNASSNGISLLSGILGTDWYHNIPCLNNDNVRCLTVFAFKCLSKPMLSPAAPSSVSKAIVSAAINSNLSRLSHARVLTFSNPKPKRSTDLSPNDACCQRGSARRSGFQIGLLYWDQFKTQKCDDAENQRNENGILRRMPTSQSRICCNICKVARRECNLDAQR